MNPDSENPIPEYLSAHLDGALESVEAAKLEKELENNPQLQATFDGLRETQSQFKELPKYRLNDSFADKVLAQLEDSTSATHHPDPASSTGTSDQRWAIGMMVTLAAMILAMLVVASPQDVGTQPTAEKGPEQKTSNEIENHQAAATEPQNTSQQPKPRRPMIREPLAMRIKNRDHVSGEVGANKVILDQVLVVTFPEETQDPVEKLKEAFASAENRVQMIQQKSPSTEGPQPSALVIIAKSTELKQTLKSLNDTHQVTVQGVSLESQKYASDLESAAQQSISSAVAVPMIPIVKSGADPELDPSEEKSLDQWFGLSATDNEPFQRFLILVK